MYENPIVSDNIEKLRKYGYEIIEPASGHLACGDSGKGKLPSPETLVEHIKLRIAFNKDMAGKKVLITAGATQEAIDPVRYITNHSTGKMGYALATMAAYRGAEVTLVSGQTNLQAPLGVNIVNIRSAADMFEAVSTRAGEQDIIIKAAAVADYTPTTTADNKIKKSEGDMSIPLKRTSDILKHLGENKKSGQFICGFSMETENMLENSRAKLERKNADMIVANNLKVAGAGFGVDTNIVTLITKEEVKELEIMSKTDVANAILDEIVNILTQY
jgi:phosphopantothenoylcysteine decarboxylase/phosphopantothenate--cysteine ligase